MMKLWDYIKTKTANFKFQTVGEDDLKIKVIDLIDRAALFSKNLSNFSCCAILCRSELMAATALLACFAAGATAVPLSKRYGEIHCNKILDSIGPRAVITDDGGELSVKELSDSHYMVPSAHPALIMCTSGTTGVPKGAMLTEDNVMTNLSDIEEYFDIGEGDRILITRPLYHSAVLTGEFLTALVKGADVRFYSEAFNPTYTLELIIKYGITVFCGTPTLLNMTSRFIRKGASVPLRHIVISGECMSREVGLRIASAFPDAKIYHVYGLTEACPRVSYLAPDLFLKYPDAVGLPLKSVRVQTRDKNGFSVNTNEEGILYVKGDNVMAGYYNDPNKTDAVLKDGWLCTGDLAVIDSEGFLRIKGRADDLIIKAGMNIYPQEIEGALRSDERTREALAYGYNTPSGVQIGLKIAGDFSSPDEVKKLCLEVLPPYQVPQKIELVSELEKNGSGKIKRGAPDFRI